jgi:AAA family ATP:ADP antiporter
MKVAAKLFDRLLDIRPQELNRVLLMSAYLLLIIASYTTTKAVRDSLFVTKIGPSQLPYVYLLIAGAMGLVSMVYSRAVNRIGLRRLIRLTSFIAISNLLLFWLLFKNDSSVWFYILYVWASLFGAITASQFWLLATHVFNPREARRVFAWVGVGGILGGIVGGGLTNRMAHRFGTESLLIFCAAMMAITVVLLEIVCRRYYGDYIEEKSDSHETGSALLQLVLRSRHLLMMVLLLTVAVIVEAFIDYEYKVVAKQSIVSRDHLTAFFGSVTFYAGISSLLFQMFLTSRILKRFGVGWAIMLLPCGLLAAFVTVAVQPTLFAVAMLQLVDGAFSYSIHRSGMELLYLPIPPQTRNAVKGFIDMFVDRSGRAIGAVLLLLLTAALALSIPALSVVAAALVAVWIATAVAAKREYMHSFRQALEKKTIEPQALQLRSLDSGTLKTLLGLLSSDDERQVLYALDLLSNTHPNRWRGHVNQLIHHPSGAVRSRAIAVLARVSDPAIAREEFIQHPDYQTARIAMASALRLQWTESPRDHELLNELLHDPSRDVVLEAIVTSGVVGHSEAVPFLIAKLGDNRLRRTARDALLKFGPRIIPDLVRRLADPTLDTAIRKRIPKVMALSGRQTAADALVGHLHRLDYDLDYAVMRALNRIRVDSPAITIEVERVILAIRREREEFDRLRAVRSWLDVYRIDHVVLPLLLRALTERLEHRLERIFRLVGLIYSPHDIYSIYYNCKVKPALRPAAIEFLDNILDAELKRTVVPLLEQTFGPENAAQQTPVHFISYTAALEMLIHGEDPWLKIVSAELLNRLQTPRFERRSTR